MFSPCEASPEVQASLDKVQLVQPKVHVKSASSPVAEVQRRGDKVNNRSRKVRLKTNALFFGRQIWKFLIDIVLSLSNMQG